MCPERAWQTKPTDRFVLKWIKLNLAARITPSLAARRWIEPWMVSVSSVLLGVLGGCLFAAQWPLWAGIAAGFGQVLDGVDGQLARLTGKETAEGAFLDSILDRYADAAMVLGLIVYLVRLPAPVPSALVLAFGFLAVAGSALISYSSARAASLGVNLGSPSLAGKGTRTTVMVVTALLASIWPPAPFLALCYLVVHPNGSVLRYVLALCRNSACR